MITSDNDRKNGSTALTRIVLVEIAQVSVLLRYGHAVEIVGVADSLDVCAGMISIEAYQAKQHNVEVSSPESRHKLSASRDLRCPNLELCISL